MARLWAMTVDFDSVAVGDTLPVLIKWETEESIQRYAALHRDLHQEGSYETVGTTPETTPEALPQKTVDGYITELLSKGFPFDRLEADGSSVQVEHLTPVRPDDTISLSGSVVGKRTADGLRLVECAVEVDNDRGEPVARARAVVSL